ncbi:hypothetical protein L0244_36310 [bacterium]|nr:hypothetical protein [bacterium]
MTSRILKFSLGFFFFLIATNVFAQLNLLEEYNFQLGASGGSELLFHDPSLGNGNAQVRFHVFPISNQESRVQIEVFRHTMERITFALLLDRVEIDFVNSTGATIKSIVLDQSLGQDGLFVIGDSADGYFENTRRLSGMAAVRSIRLRLFGNYE